jgi:hypothetical protein
VLIRASLPVRHFTVLRNAAVLVGLTRLAGSALARDHHGADPELVQGVSTAASP